MEGGDCELGDRTEVAQQLGGGAADVGVSVSEGL